MKLGKKLPVIDPAVPHLSKCMQIQQAALTADWTKAVPAWDQLGNDQYGDCTAAAAYHMAQCMLYNNSFPFDPTKAEALALYGATSGFPKVDEGAVELDVLKHWATVGIPTNKGTEQIGFAVLNPQDMNDLRLSIQWFGGVYLGLAMPLTAQSQYDAWDVVPTAPAQMSQPNSWGGHAVCALAYDQQSFTVVTWGKLVKVSVAFMEQYCDEAYAVISQDWLANSGISPPGMNWAAMTTDLQKLDPTITLPPTQP